MRDHMYLLNKEWQPTIVYTDWLPEGRQKNYKTLSGTNLDWTKDEVKEEETEPSELHEKYKEVFWKNVPVNKKNDTERIEAKIAEATLPVE